MKVRALTQFSTERDLVQIGDVVDMPDVVAEIRIKSGLVARVGDSDEPEAEPEGPSDGVETAQDARPVETAVSPRPNKPNKPKR